MPSSCEIHVEQLACNGSNYTSWPPQILNRFRTMGLGTEQVVVASILPPNIDMDDFSSLSSEDLKSL
jgi:hypothetical protein